MARKAIIITVKKIIVAPRIMHKNLLDYYRQKEAFYDVKVISKESVMSDYKGKLQDGALLYLIKKYKLLSDNAKALMHFLPYVDESIEDLNPKKLDLIENGYINKNEYLKQFFKDNEVIVVGYSKKDYELLNVLNQLDVHPTFITNERKQLDQNIVTYETVVDEVFYSLNKIAELLDSGVSINDIYIYVNCDDYLYYLDKFAPDFGFKVDINKDEPLFNYAIANIFLKEFVEAKDVDVAIGKIQDIKDADLLNAFLDVIRSSRDDELGFDSQLDYFISELKNTKYRQKRYNNVVKIIKEPIFTKDAHIFVMGFAQGQFPQARKDNQLLSDNEKERIGLNASLIDNECMEDTLLSFFSSDNHFYFSFSNRSLSQKFFISPLAETLGLNEIKTEFPNVLYSKDMKDFYYAKALDLKKYYQQVSSDYYALEKISNIPYDEYNNEFTGVKVYDNIVDLEYSYSKINMFYQCPFQYYVSRVLNVDPFEDNLNTKFGSVVHAIFEHHRDDGFDFDNEYERLVSEQEFAIEELPIVANLKVQVKEASDAILLHYRYMKNPDVIAEKNIRFNFAPHSRVFGKIDKVLLLDSKYLAIVDYKTGNSSFNSKNIEYGDSLQLPTYCFLAENDKDLKDFGIIGVFINNVIDKSLTRDPNDDSLINPYFRLNGKVVADADVISYLDNTIAGEKCEFIKGVKRLKSGEGFCANSVLASFDEIKEYAQVAKRKFLEADKRIRNNEFSINPLYIGSKGACEYCEYRDICFVKPNQRNYAEKIESEEGDDE